jgi:hypothetical protein
MLKPSDFREDPMVPTALPFLEVFGMIAIAAYFTVALVRDRPVFEGPESGHVSDGVPLLNTIIFCPERQLGADVALGFDRSGPKARLEVLSCDLLPEGETCGMACVGGIAQA